LTAKTSHKKQIIVLILFSTLLLTVLTIYLWFVLPLPVLVFSIPIRLAACVIAVTAFFFWKDWRALPLALMFFLMAARQTLTLHVRAGVIERTALTTTLCEIPGFIVTLLAFISIVYLWNLFSYREKINQSEVNLKDSEEKFRTMADFSHDWETWILPDGRYEYISPSCARITGYTSEEFIADPNLLLKITHPDDRQMMTEHQTQHLSPETEKAELEFRIITKSGQVHWIWHKCRSVFKENGTWMGRRISNRDITDKHEAEIILQRERDMFLHGPVVTFTWRNSENWPVEQVSENVNDILGYTVKEFTEGTILYASLIHPDDLNRVTSEVTTHSNSNSVSFTHEPYRLITRSGNRLWVLDTTTIIRNDQGEITHYLGYLVNISKQKRQEQIVLESAMQQEHLKRFKSLKTMAGAIAHRFNNSMMAVQGNLELMALTLPAGSNEYKMASDAAQAAKGASQVGSMMLSYVGQQPLKLQTVSLGTLVRESVTTLKSLLLSSISLQFTLPDQPLYCSVDQQQIKEVIASIFTNAVESLGDNRGTIEITFGTDYFTTDSFPIPFQNDNLLDGVYTFCQIKDSGHGINPKDLSQIFEPFYSTRFVGRGLGLALTVGIMQSHHGAITVKSIPNQGTTVRLLLPTVSPTQQVIPSDDLQGQAIQLSGNILLADDEEMVLDVGKKMLEILGFTVHTAMDGQEAVDKICENGIDFCAVVLDISMPEMDGIEAMKAIKKSDTTLPILLSSGYSEDDLPFKEGEGSKPDGFLRKPFELSDMRKSLEKLLS